MKRSVWIAVIVLAALAAGAAIWRWTRNDKTSDELALYGNVDLRQVDLAFNNSERIAAVLVQEGERVRKGQVLARLDTARIEPQLAQVEAQAMAQRQVVQRLRNGSRPEEVAQARANVDSAQADLVNARLQHERLQSAAEISAGRAVQAAGCRQRQGCAAGRRSKIGGQSKGLGFGRRRPAQRRDRRERGALASQRGAGGALAPAARRRGADGSRRRCRAHARDGAGRNGVAATDRILARDH